MDVAVTAATQLQYMTLLTYMQSGGVQVCTYIMAVLVSVTGGRSIKCHEEKRYNYYVSTR